MRKVFRIKYFRIKRMHIIIGIILIGAGVLITIKSEAILNFFGPIAFFESKLGSEGGSRLGYKLIGIFIAFIGMLALTNMFGGFINWILSPLLKYSNVGG